MHTSLLPRCILSNKEPPFQINYIYIYIHFTLVLHFLHPPYNTYDYPSLALYEVRSVNVILMIASVGKVPTWIVDTIFYWSISLVWLNTLTTTCSPTIWIRLIFDRCFETYCCLLYLRDCLSILSFPLTWFFLLADSHLSSFLPLITSSLVIYH